MFNVFKKYNKKTTEDKLIKNLSEKKNNELDEKIITHVMPEKFRFMKNNINSTKNTGLIIIIAGIILLAIVTFGVYYYFFTSQDVKTGEETVSAPDKIDKEELIESAKKSSQQHKPAVATKIEEKPKDVYLEIRKEMDKINTFAGYEQIIKKYGSKNSIIELNKQKKEYSNLPNNYKADFIASLTHSEQNIKDIEEVMSKDTAKLYLEIEGLQENAIVTMVLENNEWKFESEIWAEVKKEDNAELENFITADDSDNDGLTDKEEILFGCDADITDTDGDGFGDLAEIMNLYNPAGDNRLINNSSISKCLNNNFNYSLLYPDSWFFSNISEDASIMFRSDDNQFIQVIAQVNKEKEPISDWYKKQFSIDEIDSNKLIVSDYWQGIKTDNGLTIYLTDNQYNNIIIITYIPNANNSLDYINIFEMVIKSLEITK